jgi:hypothetical protein
MTELQEQLRHRGAGHELPRKDRLDVKFTNEVEYVSRQTLKVWEPLFGHYYATAWLLAEAAGGGRRQPPDFFRWLAEEFPEPYVELIKGGQRPPVAPAYEPAGPGSFVLAAPGQGEGLTVAYYNLLAVQTEDWFQYEVASVKEVGSKLPAAAVHDGGDGAASRRPCAQHSCRPVSLRFLAWNRQDSGTGRRKTWYQYFSFHKSLITTTSLPMMNSLKAGSPRRLHLKPWPSIVSEPAGP